MLKLSQPNISEEAIAAMAEVLRSGNLVHGLECDAFEGELAEYLGCREVVLVSSGTAALHVALLALDIGPGDAVIIPDFTFPATANVVSITGARPVIVDVDPSSYTLDPKLLEEAIYNWDGPERLRAIMPVHEFGCPAEMDIIKKIAKEYGLAVIEDAACALGASYKGRKVGTIGDIGCFSFHPRKTLTTGEGGAISTNCSDLARRMRRLRSHGMERTSAGVRFLEPALNYRLTNFQAALGRCQLPHLDGWIQLRRDLVDNYITHLSPLIEQKVLTCQNPVEGHSWQTFMLTLDKKFNRNNVITTLRERGVEANLGAQSMSSIGIYGGNSMVTVGPELFRNGLALPLFEKMSSKNIKYICDVLISTLQRSL